MGLGFNTARTGQGNLSIQDANALIRGAGSRGVEKQRSIAEQNFAPVTYVPSDRTGTINAKGSWNIGSLFRRMIPAAAAASLGAILLLSTGCATHRAGTIGIPSANAQVVMAPRGEANITDHDVRSRVGGMNATLLNSATPAMDMITRSPHVRQTVTGNYKKNIIPEFTVEKRANGKFTAVFLLPVSGHVGNTAQEQKANARHYAEIDRHKIWVKYPDGTTQTLAENLDPKGQLTYAIRLELELKPGKNEIIFSPLPEGRPELTCHDHSWPVDPSGFDVGRRQIYNVQ
jgi:hypothetical protein